MQIVYLHEANSSHVVYTAHNRGVVTRWQVCDDRRFPSVTGCVPAVHDVAHLVTGDNSTDYRAHPVVIKGNQSSRAIVQLQRWIKQRIGNSILSKLRTYGANNHPLCLDSLNNEPTDHHVVACLNKGARGDVTKPRWDRRR